ncbi:MAG: DUF1292 domain-containing protein [Firmicutes bacterium]|nr:DUF1292 domain-containing protein [Bacillota bacterium]
MNEEERDIVEFTDEDGNTLLLEVLDSFFYNGEEFAVLGDVDDACDCEACEGHDGEDDEHNLYIMKIETSTDEEGEEVEEFIPVEDELMEALIEIVQTRFFEEDDDEDDDDEEAADECSDAD